MKKIFCSALTALVAFTSTVMMAQVPIEKSDKRPYYIDLNTISSTEVYEIHSGMLHLQYTDGISFAKELPLKIYNEKMELVGDFMLNKDAGVNNYSINLGQRLSSFEPESIYVCKLVDERGTRYEWTIRNGKTTKSKDFSVAIMVNPKRMSCNGLRADDQVEFYSDIRNGKAPYSIRWYVMNQGRTDLLYQPKEEQIRTGRKTSILQVDKKPGYFVVLDVTDACGTNSRQMVFLDCQDVNKKINTIFVEPLRGTPATKIPTLPVR